MKRFKQFLAEVVGQRDVQDIVFMHMDKYDKDDTSALRKILLPMSKKMSERVFGVRNRLTAAHITNEDSVKDLVRMQGTQKSLACMTNPSDPKIWREGVATGGGIVFIVEGYPTLISNMDVYSRVDNQGRRYVPLASLSPKSSGWNISYESGYEKMLEKLKDSIFDSILRARDAIKHEIAFDEDVAKEYGVNPEFQDFIYTAGWPQLGTMTRNSDVANASGLDKKSLGRIKAYAIRRWFDEMERIWVNNWRKMKYVFDAQLMSPRNEGWNEINLVDIKLIKCYPISESAGDLWGDFPAGPDEEAPFENEVIDTGGVPIAGYIEIDMSEDDYSDDGWAAVLEIQREIQL